MMRLSSAGHMVDWDRKGFLCQDTVGKGTTVMLCRTNPAAVLLLGSMKLPLCIVVVNWVPECVVHKLIDVRVSWRLGKKAWPVLWYWPRGFLHS